MSGYEHQSIVNAKDELETVTHFEPKPGDALESRGFRIRLAALGDSFNSPFRH